MLYNNKRSTLCPKVVDVGYCYYLVEQKSVTAFFSVWLSRHFIAIYCVISKEIVPFMSRCFVLSVDFSFV